MGNMMRLNALLIVALSVLLRCCAAASEDEGLVCLSKEEIAARLSSEDRTKKRLTRVTNPGTASTTFRSNIDIVLGTGYFPRYQSFDCKQLCFASSSSKSSSDPFVELEFSLLNDGHHPFDQVMQIVAPDDHDPYLMTTLRDPFDYSVKFYKWRKDWDEPSPHIHGMSFREWVRMVPWRTNQMTRMMGREHGDKRVMMSMMNPRKPTPGDDEYMQEQNRLGQDSPVLAKAWERLSEQLVWFGLFHRLKDSMELLAFTVCANEDKLMEGLKQKPPQTNADKLQKKAVGKMDEAEKEEILEEIAQRNQLDIILLARAEELFDQRFQEMREAKERGILCKFADTVEVTCADVPKEL